MAEFTKKTLESGAVQYRNATENKIVSKDSLSELLLAKLDAAPEGTKVPEDANITENEGTKEPEIKDGHKKVTITLEHPILVNDVVYKAGEIEVDEEVAEDLVRIDREHSEYETNLLRSQNLAKEAPQIRVQDVHE